MAVPSSPPNSSQASNSIHPSSDVAKKVANPAALNALEAPGKFARYKKKALYLGALGGLAAIGLVTTGFVMVHKQPAKLAEAHEVKEAHALKAPKAAIVIDEKQPKKSEMLAFEEHYAKSRTDKGEMAEQEQGSQELKERLKSYNQTYRLAMKYRRQGQMKQAISEFKRMNEIWPGNENALLALGNAYYEMGEHEQALQCLGEAKQINTHNAAVHYLLGMVHQSMGERKQAIADFKTYLDLDPAGDNAKDVRTIVSLLGSMH